MASCVLSFSRLIKLKLLGLQRAGVPAEIFLSRSFPGKLSLAEDLVFRLWPEISFRKENTTFVPAKTFRENVMQG